MQWFVNNSTTSFIGGKSISIYVCVFILVVSRDKKKGKMTSWPCSRWTQNLSSYSAPQLPPPSPRPCSETFPSRLWLAPGALGRLALICWHALSAQPLQQGSIRAGQQLLRQTLYLGPWLETQFNSRFLPHLLIWNQRWCHLIFPCFLCVKQFNEKMRLYNIFHKKSMCVLGGTLKISRFLWAALSFISDLRLHV